MIVEGRCTARQVPPADGECESVAALVAAVQAAGVAAEPSAIVSLYVGLKSKPLTLLVGPENVGKIAVMRCLGQALTNVDTLHAQFMQGHAWWAGQSGNLALYTNAQIRLNTFKLLALLEEAHAPENRERVLLACLTRISPAELLSVFSATAFQLQHGELMRLCAAHFTEPVPYPRNLLLAGTLDAPCAQDLEPETLAMTNVVAWPANALAGSFVEHAAPRLIVDRDHGREFLASMVRTEAEARWKLKRVLHRSLAALWPLAYLEEALHRHAGHLMPGLRSELLVYLANAFTRAGHGLFAERPIANLEAALDWAIPTVIVPRIRGRLGRGQAFRVALQRVCANRWLNAAQALEALPTRM